MSFNTDMSVSMPQASKAVNPLVASLDSTFDPTKAEGENGTVEFSYDKILENATISSSSFQRSCLALFNSAIQGTKQHTFTPTPVTSSLEAILKSTSTTPEIRNWVISLLSVVAFQTRDCRKEGKGKGARDPFYLMINYLKKKVPEYKTLLPKLLTLVPEYGYWKDLENLYQGGDKDVQKWCVEIFARQLEEDYQTLSTKTEDEKPKLSLAGKWAPREGKKFNQMAKEIATSLFPHMMDHPKRMGSYRRMLSALNQTINTTEVLMCAKRFSEIKFELVPGLCLNRHRLAWENKTKKGEDRSEEEDRVLAKENYHKFLDSLKSPESKGAKGTSVFIHDLVQQIMTTDDPTQLELLEAQWMDHEKLLKEHAEKTGIGLNNFLPLSDFSGSMNGDPMNLAMALGIMIARLQTGPWHGRILTFESTPHWIDISECKTIKECITKCQRAPWGGSTDFFKAHQMILEVMKEGKHPLEVLPKVFMVISDMQFDVASERKSGWDTMHKTLTETYARVGMETVGTPYQLPMMVYWNARGDTGGMPVTESQEGAVMVSGFSTSLLKLFLETSIDALLEYTPWKLFLQTMTDKHYERVWEMSTVVDV